MIGVDTFMEINGEEIWLEEDDDDHAEKVKHHYRNDIYPATIEKGDGIASVYISGPPSFLSIYPDKFFASGRTPKTAVQKYVDERRIRRKNMIIGSVEREIPYSPRTREAWPFPFDEMEVGDSFAVTPTEEETVDKIADRVTHAIQRRKAYGPERFSYRTIRATTARESYIRVWRTK